MDKAVLTLAALRGDGCALELCFQPILPVTGQPGDSPNWFEALLRLRLSSGKLLSPGAFMPPDTIRNMEALAAIDFWVLKQVAALLHQTPHTYSINFSRYMLQDPLVVRRVTDLAGGYRGRLVLEVSEKYHWTEFEIEIMEQLRKVARLSMDDVGLGRLIHLDELPVTGFKIDGSIIERVLARPKARSIVRLLLRFATEHQINCVCEYVSSPEIWQWLKVEHCQLPGLRLFVQGHAVGEYRQGCQKIKPGDQPGSTSSTHFK